MADINPPITKQDLHRSLQVFGKQLVVGIIGQLRWDMRANNEALLQAIQNLEQSKQPEVPPVATSTESGDIVELKAHIEELLNAHTEEMLQAIADMVEPLHDQTPVQTNT